MQEGFKHYVNNFQLDVLTNNVLKKKSNLPPPPQYPCNLTEIIHLGTKSPHTLISFQLKNIQEIFRYKKCGEELSFCVPKSSIFLQSLVFIHAIDIGKSAEAI